LQSTLAKNPLRTRSDAQQLARDLFQSLVPDFSPAGPASGSLIERQITIGWG
jgi:hypothetical protein